MLIITDLDTKLNSIKLQRISQKAICMCENIAIFARNKFINLHFMSSFVADKITMDGLTFDDVLLIPA